MAGAMRAGILILWGPSYAVSSAGPTVAGHRLGHSGLNRIEELSCFITPSCFL